MSIEAPIRTTHHSLKEWAVAIQALRGGDSIITVRKGGIREDAREFRMEHQQFVFFPTYEHQNRSQLQTRFVPQLDAVLASAPPPGILRLDTWAEVTDVLEVHEEQQVQALEAFYVFSQAYALERLQWRPKKPLHILLLRVYRLPDPLDLAMHANYGGCKSWIELTQPVSLDRMYPALDEEAFRAVRERALAALGTT